MFAYDRCLRRPGDPPPAGQDLRGKVHLPKSMAAYKHGLWLLVPRAQANAEYWWWSGGHGPQQLQQDHHLAPIVR